MIMVASKLQPNTAYVRVEMEWAIDGKTPAFIL